MFSESDLAELPDWPTVELGAAAEFLRQGFSYQLRDNRRHSELGQGMPVSQLQSRQTVVDLQGTLLLSQQDIRYFEWWWANVINHGNDYFKMPLITGAGVDTVVAKFAENGRGASTLSGLKYRVSCRLIITELPGVRLSKQHNIDVVTYGAPLLERAADKLYEIVHGAW